MSIGPHRAMETTEKAVTCPKRYFCSSILWTLVVIILFSLCMTAQASGRDILHFCYYDPDNEANDPILAVRAMQPFADYIGNQIGKTISIHFFIRRTDADAFLAKQTVAMAILSPYYYVENRNKLHLEPIAIPFVGEDTSYRLVLIAKKSEKQHTLTDFRGKSFVYNALVEENYPFLNKVVFKKKLAVETFFSELLDVTTPLSAVMNMLEGKADCALIVRGMYQNLIELDPRINRECTVIYSSDAIPRPPVCTVGNNLSPELRETIAALLFSMHESSLGQQTLLPFKVDGYRPTNAAAFDDLSQILQ